ncbi:MAG: hypothetical protein ACFCGT_16170 [Sandaracinaceae bacterium]
MRRRAQIGITMVLALGGAAGCGGSLATTDPAGAEAEVASRPPRTLEGGPALFWRSPNLRQRLNNGEDPARWAGRAGGPVAAADVQPGGGGYVSPEPSHDLTSEYGLGRLRFLVLSDVPTTLLLRLPTGEVRCAAGGAVEVEQAHGQVLVWVGTAEPADAGAPYTLAVPRNADLAPSDVERYDGRYPYGDMIHDEGPLWGNARALERTLELPGGFSPSPAIRTVFAEGSVPGARVDPSCSGFFARRPTFFIYSNGFPVAGLRILTNGAGLATRIAVIDVEGRVTCDDGTSRDAAVTFPFEGGHFRVWIGTAEAGPYGPVTVAFSEDPTFDPADVPPPPANARPPEPVPLPDPVDPITLPEDAVVLEPGIPASLLGPGLPEGAVLVWQPSSGPPLPVFMKDRALMVVDREVADLPSRVRSPVVTLTARADDTLFVRVEHTPEGDDPQQLLWLVRWHAPGGRASRRRSWSGSLSDPPPDWSGLATPSGRRRRGRR